MTLCGIYLCIVQLRGHTMIVILLSLFHVVFSGQTDIFDSHKF